MAALNLVTGYQGQDHVTADQMADFNRGIYGDAAILPVGNKMAVQIQTANQLTVEDGVAVIDGREVYIGYGETENIPIVSGTQSMLRNDIVVMKYSREESTGIETVEFEVLTGTPSSSNPKDPAYQNMDIRTGVFSSQKPFCRVRLNGVAIEGIDMLMDVKEFDDHAFLAPVQNLTTTTPGKALDAVMGKKLQEAISEQNEKIPKTKIETGTTDTWGNIGLGSYPSLTILSAVSLKKSSYVKRVFLNDYNIWYAEVVDSSGNAIANTSLSVQKEYI